MGYSAVLFSSHTKRPDFQYVSLEISPIFCSMANSVIKRAGLANFAESRLGILENHLEDLKKEFGSFDLIFLDHSLKHYLPHLKLLEQHGLLHDETYFIADNVKFPGAPDYVEYVLKNYDTQLIDTLVKPHFADQISLSKPKKK